MFPAAVDEPAGFGSMHLGRGTLGARLNIFSESLTRLIDGATIVVFEQPLIPTGKKNKPNIITQRTLFSLAGVTEMICHQRGVPCFEEHHARTRKAFMGHMPKTRDEIKRAVVKSCQMRGWHVANDDEADACALAHYTISVLGQRTLW